MNTILVINCGSSSVKIQVIDESDEVIVKGSAEKLGLEDAHIKIKYKEKEINEALKPGAMHKTALERFFKFFDEENVSKSLIAVGHRVVHGGEVFKDSVVVTPKVLSQIKKFIPLAPLHQPANILGIKTVSKINSNLPQVAVFDTAFHADMPESSFRYALPKEWYEEYSIRKYGFHGTSYKFITSKASKILNKDSNELNLIIAHLGSGASMAAIKNGKSVDTTMGFSPNAGLPMGTRSGDIDTAIIPYVIEKTGQNLDEVMSILNKKSGQIGVSGVSDDIRYVIEEAEKGNKDAGLSFNIFTKKCAEFIAGLMSNLSELDALIFTGGMGENGPETRDAIVARLKIFGFEIDPKMNEPIVGRKGKEGKISSETSKYPIYMLITNEELEIARETKKLLS